MSLKSHDDSPKGSLATVFLVVLIDLMGFGIILPLLPFYAQIFSAGAVTIGLLYSVYSLGQLIFSPIWGGYSDRIGRRPIMLLSTGGAVIAYIIFGLAESLTVLFLSRIIAGIMGGNISTAQAYISDVTSRENRARGMGLIGAAFGIGFVVGPALATLLIHDGLHDFIAQFISESVADWASANKYSLPGFFAAFLSFCSFLLVWLKLPESIKRKSELVTSNKITPKRLTVFQSEFWKDIGRSDITGNVKPLLSSSFLLSFGEATLYSAFPLFCEKYLGMSAEQVGIQFLYIGIIAVIIQGGLIRPLTKKFGEKPLFTFGCIFLVIGLALIPFATSIPLLSVFLGIMAIGKSLNTPTLFSLISQEAGRSSYGKMLGTSQGLSGLGRVIGPTWGGVLFGLLYWSPFVATAAILTTTIAIGVIIQRNSASVV